MSDNSISNEFIVPFILGGKSEFWLSNVKSGNKFHFKISTKDSNISFIRVVKGSEDVYAGFIRKVNSLFAFSSGNKGVMSVNDMEVKALLYVLNNASKLPNYIEIIHMGKCSACGRKLTDIQSIRRGLGPECAKKAYS